MPSINPIGTEPGGLLEITFISWAVVSIVLSQLVLRSESLRAQFPSTALIDTGGVYEMEVWGIGRA
ncbi:hypothetical protein PHLCEN_2v11436 [Hermanssonia centrifuga]|uniref:Uncharacterized protein n=1 Tax=Hermanssonia centrifuga TaxID=98765 RepID=A0A2R6NKB0_9APHY|nr:hypothetical protein PHLCEN_2v11436 [Hermanssonia centrifuga]